MSVVRIPRCLLSVDEESMKSEQQTSVMTRWNEGLMLFSYGTRLVFVLEFATARCPFICNLPMQNYSWLPTGVESQVTQTRCVMGLSPGINSSLTPTQ